MVFEKLTIENIKFGDISDVLELEKNTLSAWNEEHLKDELQQSAGFQFVARDKASERIMAVLFGRIAADEAEILKLSVADFARKKGVGFQLLDFALNYCRTRGMKNCYLELRASNEAARHLYEKRGFISAGTHKDYYDEPTEDAILMQFELKTCN